MKRTLYDQVLTSLESKLLWILTNQFNMSYWCLLCTWCMHIFIHTCVFLRFGSLNTQINDIQIYECLDKKWKQNQLKFNLHYLIFFDTSNTCIYKYILTCIFHSISKHNKNNKFYYCYPIYRSELFTVILTIIINIFVASVTYILQSCI